MKLGISQKSSFLWYKQIAIVGECFLIILVAPRNIDISDTEFVDEIAVELTDNCKYPFLSVIAEFIYSTLPPVS